MTDIDLDDEEDQDPDFTETPAEYAKRMAAAGKPLHVEGVPDPAAMARKAEEAERKRWEKGRQDEIIRDASLRAWEKERLADAEAREARLAPLVKRDPFCGGMKPQVPRMAQPKEKSARRYEPHTDALDDAETELTAVIAECRYFMREMAFESARLTPDTNDRLSFIDSARKLAETSAAVGKSIASVRHPSLVEPEERKRARR
jgi:hypothetical protein